MTKSEIETIFFGTMEVIREISDDLHQALVYNPNPIIMDENWKAKLRNLMDAISDFAETSGLGNECLHLMQHGDPSYHDRLMAIGINPVQLDKLASLTKSHQLEIISDYLKSVRKENQHE